MKLRAFFLIFSFVTGCEVFAQPQEILPYKGGEAKFAEQLGGFAAEISMPSDDTVFFFLFQISHERSMTDKTKFEVFGPAGDIKNQLQDFFQRTKSGWDEVYISETSIVIPVFLLYYNLNTEKKTFDTRKLYDSKMPANRKALFIKPMLFEYWGSVQICTDF